MTYGIRHLDGSSDEGVGVSPLSSLYDELSLADGEHTDVAVIDDDTGWCVAAYASGLVLFECLADGSSYHMRGVKREEVIEMWTKLAHGAIGEIKALPWKSGTR